MSITYLPGPVDESYDFDESYLNVQMVKLIPYLAITSWQDSLNYLAYSTTA